MLTIIALVIAKGVFFIHTMYRQLGPKHQSDLGEVCKRSHRAIYPSRRSTNGSQLNGTYFLRVMGAQFRATGSGVVRVASILVPQDISPT